MSLIEHFSNGELAAAHRSRGFSIFVPILVQLRICFVRGVVYINALSFKQSDRVDAPPSYKQPTKDRG